MIEKQVITTWNTPEEKMPPEDMIVAVTYSGKDGNIGSDHALGAATWSYDGPGWLVNELSE